MIDLNGAISSSRPVFDDITGLSSADLSHSEVDLLRAESYRRMAAQADELMFVKVHDAYYADEAGVPVFPADCSVGAIYLVRDPLDVCVSYAHHRGNEPVAETAAQMNADRHGLGGGGTTQLHQETFGWSGHYRSWHDQRAIRLLTIRYEDMLDDTAACLQRMAAFLNLPQAHEPGTIARAVARARFDRLREKEERHGFRERPRRASSFFRAGRAGDGRSQLPPDVIAAIENRNRDLMAELGYLET